MFPLALVITDPCNIITDLWENKKLALATILDIRKAFDSLNRKILIKKTQKPTYQRSGSKLVDRLPN